MSFRLSKYIDLYEQADVPAVDDGNVDLFLDVTNSSVLEEEHFNTTEHRGFLHGFVESLSVILVSLALYS